MNFIELFVVPTVVKRFFSVINMGVVFIQVLVYRISEGSAKTIVVISSWVPIIPVVGT